MILVLTIFLSTVNISFVMEIEEGALYSYDIESMESTTGCDIEIEDDNTFVDIKCAENAFYESAIPNKE